MNTWRLRLALVLSAAAGPVPTASSPPPPPPPPSAQLPTAAIAARLAAHAAHNRLLQTPTTETTRDDENNDDFAVLNRLLDGTVLSLPDVAVNKDLPGPLSSVDIFLTNLQCGDLYLHDLAMDHDRTSAEEVDLSFSLEVDLSCTFDWEYGYDAGFLGTLGGEGTGEIITENNALASTITFSSPDFDTIGPVGGTVEECNAETLNVNVVDMNFDGKLSATIINTFEFAVRNVVEDEVKDKLCEELGNIGDLISKGLLGVKESIVPFLPTDAAGDESSSATNNNPLSAEEEFAASSDMQLFDFAGGGLIAAGIDAALSQVNSLLGKTNSDGELGVNVLVRKHLLDEDGSLTIPLTDLGSIYQGGGDDIPLLDEVDVAIESVRLNGLDTFTRMEALSVIGSQTLQSRFALQSLEVEVEAVVTMRASDEAVSIFGRDADASPSDGSSRITERLVLKAAVRDLDATAALFLAVDRDRIGDLQLGSLLLTGRIPECLMASLHAVELTRLLVSAGDIDPPTAESKSSDGVTRVANAAFEAITEMYEALFLQSLPVVFDTSLRPLFNDMAQGLLTDAKKAGCPSPPDMTDATAVDMRDLLLQSEEAAAEGGLGTMPYGNLVSLGKAALDEMLLTPDVNGALPINDMVIGPLTKSQSGIAGTLTMPGSVINEAITIDLAGLRGEVELRVFDISIEHIDSLSEPIGILEPEGAYIVDNGVTVGVSKNPFRVSMGLLIAITGKKQAMRNELNLSIELSAAELFAAFGIKMEEEALMRFPLRDALNPWCWLATVPAPKLNGYGVRDASDVDMTLSLKDLRASVRQMKFGVECISCTSPGLQRWTDVASSPEAIEDATSVTNMLLNYVTSLLDGDMVQVNLDRLLNQAASQCPHDPSYGMTVPEFTAFSAEAKEYSDDSSASFFLALGVIAVILAVVITLLVFVVRFVVRRRHQRWLKTLSADEVGKLLEEQQYEKEHGQSIDRSTRSLALSSSIPLLWRLSIPVIIIVNIWLFLSGHLSLGGTVNIVFQVGEEDMSAENFYSFSVAQTVIEMWNAGAHALAILICIFSGVWPYTKQLTTLVLWFMPPTWVSNKKRGTILLWLDALGKYSFVDIFVLIVAIVAFRVSVQSPSYAFLPENLYSIDLVLVALWGLYANMTAQVLSGLNSHVIIHYHNKVVHDAESAENSESGQETSDDDIEQATTERASSDSSSTTSSSSCEIIDEETTALSHRIYGLGDHKPTRAVAAKKSANVAAIIVAVAVVTFIIIGCTIPSFSFETLGIVGVAVESGQKFDRAIAYYSLFSIVGSLFDQARFLESPAQWVGMGTLSVILIVTTFIMPLVLVGMFLQLWFASMTTQRVKRTLSRIQILSSWQYVEVYVFSVIIAAWQVGDLSSFMVNEYCSSLDKTFSTLVTFGVLNAEDGQCFYVRSRVESGTYMLIVGAIALAILGNYISKAAAQRLHEEQTEARRRKMWKEVSWRSSSPSVPRETDSSQPGSLEEVHPVGIHFTDTYRWLLEYASAARHVGGSITNAETTRSSSAQDSVADIENDQQVVTT